MINLNLNGKKALVCGASQGIGKACADELAALGCEVVALARNSEKLAKLPYRYISVDMGNLDDLQQKVLKEVEHGGIEILINNTGGPRPGLVSEASVALFQEAFTQHMLASVALVNLLLPYMKAVGYGRIINILSTSVKSPLENLGVSNTMREAVAAWSKTLSYEVARFGITVNSVLPGSTDTERLRALMQHQADQAGKNLTQVQDAVIANIPAGRLAKAEEIAQVAAFLATPAGSYVNGVAWAVDGGRTKVL